MTIRTILVDDEPLATQGLSLRLEAHDDVEIVATAANGREAIRAIKTHKPDLVFLDIQMPGFDGFSVIQGLLEVEPPLFVFVTAYGDHAIRAFEAQAVDYLMKPVEEDRLAATLDRVRQRLQEKRGVVEVERLKEALEEHAPEAAETLAEETAAEAPLSNRFEKMINIKDQGQIFRVDVDSIERIDAAGDYMCIMTGDNTLILRETMKDLEKRLDPAAVPAGAPLDHRQPRPGQAGQAAHQWRMLPGAQFRRAGEGVSEAIATWWHGSFIRGPNREQGRGQSDRIGRHLL